MKEGMKADIVKEPDNKFDREAIMVMMPGVGKIGYVANSPHTVKGDSYSDGRMYDHLRTRRRAKSNMCLIVVRFMY